MSARGPLLAGALALSLLAGWGCSRRDSAAQVAAWDAELAALQATQDSLRRRSDEIVAADPRVQALPKGDVVLGVPTAFLRTVIARVFEDVASNATLSLGGIHVHVEKSVKKIVTIGNFVVDIDIHEVIGRLKPGQPTITFGDNVIAMSLPVRLHRGHGAATVHFTWDGKNVAGAACGDMDVTQKVAGNAIPSNYAVAGRLKLAIAGNKIVCTPVFPVTRINIRVKPSKASYAAIDSILAEKHGVCGWVLEKVDVPSILTNLVEVKGFNVKLPIDKIKPFTISGGISDTLTVGDHRLSVASKLNTFRIERDAIWYSADVALEQP